MVLFFFSFNFIGIAFVNIKQYEALKFAENGTKILRYLYPAIIQISSSGRDPILFNQIIVKIIKTGG